MVQFVHMMPIWIHIAVLLVKVIFSVIICLMTNIQVGFSNMYLLLQLLQLFLEVLQNVCISVLILYTASLLLVSNFHRKNFYILNDNYTTRQLKFQLLLQVGFTHQLPIGHGMAVDGWLILVTKILLGLV